MPGSEREPLPARDRCRIDNAPPRVTLEMPAMQGEVATAAQARVARDMVVALGMEADAAPTAADVAVLRFGDAASRQQPDGQLTAPPSLLSREPAVGLQERPLADVVAWRRGAGFPQAERR